MIRLCYNEVVRLRKTKAGSYFFILDTQLEQGINHCVAGEKERYEMDLRTETVRNQLNQFLKDYGLMSNHMAKVLKWDYTTFLKFKNGKEEVSEERKLKLVRFMLKYAEVMKQMD